MTDPQPAHPDAEVPAEHEVPEDLRLAGEFPPATREQWRDLVAGVLRKAGREQLPDPVEEALRRTVATGVTVGPLYTAEDAGELPTAAGVPGLPPFVRGARAGAAGGNVPGSWDIRQRHAHPDVAVTREAIAADLENGVTSLWLVLGEGAIPVGSLGEVLTDVLLDLAPVTVQGGEPAAEALLDLVEGRTDLAPGGSLGLDPLGLQAASGQEQDLSGLAALARRAMAPSTPTPGPPRSRSSAARWPPASRTCGRSPTGACRSTRRSGSWSSGSPPAPTSSRPSPASARPGGCGTASGRSAAPPPTSGGSDSTPSPPR
jgi:methylmalonyl-CoA mutase